MVKASKSKAPTRTSKAGASKAQVSEQISVLSTKRRGRKPKAIRSLQGYGGIKKMSFEDIMKLSLTDSAR